jgi:hypothetical protein
VRIFVIAGGTAWPRNGVHQTPCDIRNTNDDANSYGRTASHVPMVVDGQCRRQARRVADSAISHV